MGHSRRGTVAAEFLQPQLWGSCKALARQCIHQMDPGHKWAFHCHQSGFSVSSWDTHGCSKERHQSLGGSTSLLQRTCMYSLAVTTLPALILTCHPEPPTPLPCPQSPTLLSLLAFPEAAQLCHCLLFFYNPHFTSFILSPALSLSLSSSWVSQILFGLLFPTLYKPILPNSPTSFPT